MARYNRQKRSRTSSQTNRLKPEDNQQQSANVRNKGNGSVIMAIAIAVISGTTLVGGYYQPDLFAAIFNSPELSEPKPPEPTPPEPKPEPKPEPTPKPPEPKPEPKPDNSPKAPIPNPPVPNTLSPSQIYQKLRPAVVFIYTNHGQGSGMIADQNGMIITNEHVVRGQTQVKVKSTWGRVYDGTVIAVNASADLAIVKIQSDRVLTCIPLETRPIVIGQTVYALGNPLGMESTFTNGMVSRIEGNGDVVHTTAIAPGSSGSPLLDENGHAIAINKAVRRDLIISISTPAAAIANLTTKLVCTN